MTRKEFIGLSAAAGAGFAIGNPKRGRIGSRRIFSDGENLPYDSEVEYIESTGTQWIDTGIGYYADFECTLKLRRNVSNKALGNARESCLQRRSAEQPYWDFCVNGTHWYSTIPIIEWHTVSWIGGKVSCDGEILRAGYNKPFSAGSMLLFNVPGYGGFQNMIAGCILYDINGNVVRDFCPVRFINEAGEVEGAFYDRVSCAIFRNRGSGEFLIGPDRGQ